MICCASSAGGWGICLGGISWAVRRSATSDQRGNSAFTMSSEVKDLMSNCAVGIGPLWQPAQYLPTKGRTVFWNCLSRSGESAAIAVGVTHATEMAADARMAMTGILISNSLLFIFGLTRRWCG